MPAAPADAEPERVPESGAVEPGATTRASFEPVTLRSLVVDAFPALALVVIVIVLALLEGGFAVTRSAGAGIALVTLTAVVVALLPHRFVGRPASSWWAAALLGAFAAWTFLSIAWAGDRGDAWNGANRTLLYVVAFALVARWCTSARAAAAVLFLLAAALATVGLVTLWRISRAAEPFGLTVGGRLSSPIGYPNATAALFMLAAWPLLAVAHQPRTATALRVAAFPLAGTLAYVSLAAQSRGSIYTLCVVALAYLALSANRGRALVALAVTAGLTALLAGPALDIFNASTDAELRSSASRALSGAGVLAAALAAFGLLTALADAKVRLSPRVARRLSRALFACTAVALVVAAVALSPWDRVPAWWDDFRSSPQSSGVTSRFRGFGSHRYDFWRVAWHEFTRHPVGGSGVDQFEIPYLSHRQTSEQAIYPHSVVVAVVSQTGIAGVLLLLAGLAAAVLALLRLPRGSPERDVGAAALLGTVVLAAHGSVDWLWEIPALGLAGATLLALACAVARVPSAAIPVRTFRPAAFAVTAAAALAATSFALPWQAERSTLRAGQVWRSQPDVAFDLLTTASRLNLLSDRPNLVAGAIAGRLGRWTLMRDELQVAVRRNRGNWYAHLLLAIAAARTGDVPFARVELGHARRLNPREDEIDSVGARLLAGRAVDLDQLDEDVSGL